MRADSLSVWLGRAMLAIFLAVCAAALVLGVTQERAYTQAFLLALVCVAAALWLLRPLCRLAAELGTLRIWIALTALCLAVKGAWVLLVQVPMSGDYTVFWGYAQSLAQSETIDGGRYMALFPHIFGYASFLSWFIRVLGPLPLLAQTLNVVLSVCSGSLLFLLGERWWGLPAGISAYLFWIACPSQTMYNSLVLSEPLYTTLILLFLLLATCLTRWSGRPRPVLRGALWGIAAGLLLRWINGLRPIAAILLIASFLWVLLLRSGKLKDGGTRRLFLPFLAVMTAVYLVTGPLWNAHIARRIGEEPSTTPGYSVLVGFNPASGGRWNQQDSDTLFGYSDQPGATAQQAQAAAMEDAKARITSGQVDFTALFQQKIRTFLGSDDTCVGYSSAVLRHTELFSKVCNGFYYGIVLLSLAGAVQLWRRGAGSAALLAPLYVLGLTSAQMLVEVAGRYHYSLIPMLVLVAQAGLWDTGTSQAARPRRKHQ